ncbi:carboxymuconolactone decarboxylase family protein [Pseudonocardia xishanensis]|uniref:Carboxymuconolactone decarboxylase family protein n=1 Tax=Pseudonocardia xishanensis TaxID=630995 RepID=A0ABP8RVS3_9PSEU
MALVPYLDAEDLDPADRDLLARPIFLYRALVNSPAALRAIDMPTKWIRFDCELAPRLKELVMLQVGYLMGNAYEFSHHVKLGYDFGVTDDDIRGLVEEAHGRRSDLGETERAVLTATRAIVVDGAVGDIAFKALEELLGRARAVDVVVIAGFYVGIVRILDSLQVDVEEDYLPYLTTHPLPDTPLA